MFARVLWSTLWLVLFKAGPQDFPYAPQLTRVLIPLGVVANFLVFQRFGLPPTASLVMAGTAIIALGFVTRALLRARDLEARFTQTFDALLAANAAFTFTLLIPLGFIAPILLEVAQNPEQLRNAPLQLPQGPVWAMNLLNFWNFAVTAHILRHAIGVSLWVGVLTALVITLAVLFLMILAGSFITALLV